MKMEVTVSGIQRLQAKATRRANFLGKDGMRSLCEEFGLEMVTEMRENINSMTPGSVQDLKESTKKQKERKYGRVYPILRATDQLFLSMYSKVVRVGQQWVIRLGFRGQHTGGISNARLAEIHINGEGRMPARDFTELRTATERKWVQRIRAALKG